MCTRKLRLVLFAFVGLSAATALGLTFYLRQRAGDDGRRTAPSDPRLEYAGPFRNVNPAVRYIPESRCAGCHREEATTFAAHPMGRSLLPTEAALARPSGPRHDSPVARPFEALGSQFRIERDGDGVRHRRTKLDAAGRPVAEQEWKVDYVVGSGVRGYSYLCDRDGYLFQTPLSWYSQKKVWDLSPGFGPSLLTGRAVVPDCLYCHANRVNPVEGSVNHYTRPVFDGHAIGCQRCHGPGELHAAGPGKGPDGVDPTIVNPKHLAPELREAICEQCHLQGAARTLRRGRGLSDFRPGLPLASFWSVFLRAPEAGEGPKAVGQVEQMYQSRCFQDSEGPGRLGCVSCHDPHESVPPARRVAHYRGRCLECHQKRGCSLPLAERLQKTAEDSCIDCHMPPYGAADIPHTAATDHRILRGGKRLPHGRALPASGDGLPVVSFYRGRPEVDDGEDERGRAIALVRLTLGGDASAAGALGHALIVLEAAVRRDPGDLPAAEERGYALALQSRSSEALAAFQAILADAPERELALVGAASAAETLGQTEAALGYWRRAVAANPWAPGYRRSFVQLLVKQEAWEEARPESRAWVRLDPFSAEARTARVQCLLATGDKEEARTEFATLEALAPTNLRELRIRFEKRLK
jgi:hypothetical protein